MAQEIAAINPRVVVAGDVCLDVVGTPRPGKTIDDGAKDNWQLSEEMRTNFFTGGASLLARFMAQATGETVAGPRLPRPSTLAKPAQGQTFLEDTELGRLTSDEVVHSILELCEEPREEHGTKSRQWRVKTIHGFSGPQTGDPALRPVIATDTCNPELLVLDDTGNGFRRTEAMWPCALKAGGNPGLIIHKLHRPLPEPFPTEGQHSSNPLHDRLRQGYEARSIVVVDINDLRAEGAMISCGLSWEKSVLELLWHLRGNPRFAALRECRHLVIRINMDGALYYYNPGREYPPLAWLVYDPKGEEGGFKHQRRQTMVGLGSAFTAALGAHMIVSKATPETLSFAWDDVKNKYSGNAGTMLDGIARGLAASRKLFLQGFGDATKEPAYPVTEIFDDPGRSFCSIAVPIFTDAENPDPVQWTILDTLLPEGSKLDEVAAHFACKKKAPELEKVPSGVFKFLTTYDRHEIEAYRAISTLMREYLQNPAPKRPLSLAVFGPPGSGKSFGVQNVVEHVQGENKVETLTFNLSQLQSPEELAAAFHLVRNAVVRGRIPLVFFDEFDTSFQSKKLGWLRYFLAPMQDGVFLDRGATHPIGKAIFVFAGGICSTFEDFNVSAESLMAKHVGTAGNDVQLSEDEQKKLAEFKDAKGTSMISKVKGKTEISLYLADGFHWRF